MNRDNASILDIDAACRRALEFSAGLTKAELAANEEKRSAIIYQLIIIGEATKRLSETYRSEHPELPWRAMAGMRDVMAHQYDKININTLWDVVSSEIPKLVELIAPLRP
ncbi:MAG: DUF86 domain-containing protein [Cyanobacteria bacterium J06632_3]